MAFDIGPKLVSKLGSPDSKINLGMKDSFNSAGYTYFSYDAGGSVEGKDRFVDEVGTGIIWLFGIPINKKIVDKTLYNFMGISPKVDIRTVKNSDYFKKAIEHAPTNDILKEIKTAGNRLGTTKALTISKFIISMALTMLSYLGLTKAKQKMTKLNIEKEFNKKMQNQNADDKQQNGWKTDYISYNQKMPVVFTKFEKFNENYTPSFGNNSTKKMVEEFMLNPTKNMMLLDAGITGERLSNARTEGEFKEYAIKEGSFLFFAYCADKIIKKQIEKFSQKFLNMPIALDAKFLSSNLSENILKDKNLQNEVKMFNDKILENKKADEIYDFIFKNQDNTVIKAAKTSGIISTLKNNKIDPRKYIDIDEIKQFTKNLQTYIDIGKKSNNTKKFLTKIRTTKVISTIISIGSCCLSLGYLVPKYMYEYRNKQQNGSKDFHVRVEYEKELASRAA